MKKRCLVFSGPSGVGKSTLVNFVLNNFDSVGTTVSCTSRPPRASEKNGVEYYFISKEEFDERVKNGEFIEHVELYGNKYGTLKTAVSDILKDKDLCILDLDFEGAYNILSNNLIPNFKVEGILVLPLSIKSLKTRLMNRRTETEEEIQRRLDESFNAKKIASYKHIIFNNDLEVAKAEISKILQN
ncbi:MAG: guanylate kinase [Holosporales bacterium]|jgi:guanylate kinase|nr:guanylate kinase [Holosporales bacterium]